VLPGETSFLERYGDAVEPSGSAGISGPPAPGGYLRRQNGRCVFLDANERCSIYPQRPVYCRLFPLVRDSYPERQIDANFSCPGLGDGEPFTEEDYAGVARLESSVADLAGWEAQHREAHDFACRQLADRQAFATTHAMAAAARQLVRAALQRGPALDVGERLHRLTEARRPAFLSCGNVDSCQTVLALFAYDATEREDVFDGEAAERTYNYLALWTRRNLILRAAHAMALASPLPVNVAHHYVALVAKVARDLGEAAWRLPHCGRIPNAVQQLDAGLRSHFMRASISAPSPRHS
jgi:hypothetical protein